MSLLGSLGEVVRLPLHPRRTLSAIDRGRTLLDGVIVLGLSILLSVVAAEVGAVAPYRPARGLGVSFPFGPEADLQNAGIAFQGRFLYPLIVAILTILVWVVGGLFIHAFATGLGGVGSFYDYLKLAAYVVGIVLIILAAIYLAMPADSLPSFLPGYDPGMTRPRLKHGIASGVVGVILILAGWYLGRSRS